MGVFDIFRSGARKIAFYATPVAQEDLEKESLLHINKGNELEAEGHFDDALKCYEAAISLTPDWARVHLNRGNALLGKGDFKAALSAYSIALAKDPNYAGAHFNLGNAFLQSGVPESACVSYERALRLNPGFVDAYVALGVAQEELGNLDAAIESYQHALELRSDYAEVHCNLGHALKAANRVEDAIASYRRTLEVQPDYIEALNGLTTTLRANGRVDELLEIIRSYLNYKPDSPEAHKNLGVALLDAKLFAEALPCFAEAIRLSPNFIDAFLSKGLCYQLMGRLEEACLCNRDAYTIAPESSDVCSSLGNVLLLQENFSEAESIFRHALALPSAPAKAYCDLGNVLQVTGRLDEAIENYRKALAIDPNFAGAYSALAGALKNHGQPDAALQAYTRAIELDPLLCQAHNNLGVIFQEVGLLSNSEASFLRALDIKPDFGEASLNLSVTYAGQARFDEAMICIRRAVALLPDDPKALSCLLFLQNYMNDLPPNRLLDEARLFGALVERKASRIFNEWPNAPQQTRTLRIGFVSADLYEHPVGHFLESVVYEMHKEHSHCFELFAYSNSFVFDVLSERLKENCTGWRSIRGVCDSMACEMIRDDQVDILIDLSGHTHNDRLALFASKPAPIQMTWLGYFATTGVAAIDYLIADPWTLPESFEVCFTEKIVRLPETRLCFTPPKVLVGVNLLPALKNGYITFGCFNTLTKMTDQVVELWSQILKETNNSRLVLRSHLLNDTVVQQKTLERFLVHGIDASRISLEKSVPRREYLAAYNDIDIALDPFPYCGGTTTVEALWMGVPVLTLAGSNFLSRQGVGLLMNSGLPEWVASDCEDYVLRAVKHASDYEYLGQLRQGLRKQVLSSAIFDASRFSAYFSDCLRSVWCEWCAKQEKA